MHGVSNVRFNKKAISILILLILMLGSAVFGAVISYLGVMTSFYNMPSGVSFLIVENADFPLYNASYFDVTILNPSNSALDINITAIRLNVEGRNESLDINTTEPALSILSRGTRQTFRCKRNWSNFAGETVRIEPLTANAVATTKSYSIPTPNVRLSIEPSFDVSRSVEYFNLAVLNNAGVDINLTISEIKVFGIVINENVTPSLTPPLILPPGQSKVFQCNYNWEHLRGGNATVTVRTAENYEAVYTTSKLTGAVLFIDEVNFDYTNTTYFNLLVSSSELSDATMFLDRINLTLPDQTTITLNNTDPPLYIIPIAIPQNSSLSIRCYWDWNLYRNKTITVKVFTKQGFTPPSKAVTTPMNVVWNITDVKFNLDDLQHFSMNVTNMPCSLQDINVTRILVGGNTTIMDPSFKVLTNDEQISFNNTYGWGHLRGKNVTLTVSTKDGSNVSRIIAVPSAQLTLAETLNRTDLLGPYVNVTISNSVNSLKNVTINKIVFETRNTTYTIDGTITNPLISPGGYVLKTGETITIVCRWNHYDQWFIGTSLRVTVYTAEGVEVTKVYFK
jgi:hypothetical protein